jgi:hypothetical protein
MRLAAIADAGEVGGQEPAGFAEIPGLDGGLRLFLGIANGRQEGVDFLARQN